MLKIFVSILLIFVATITFGAKINFITSLSKAQTLAKEEDKLIFVDVMADWCGPCKRMINDIEGNEELVTYFNENFINLKINEKYNRQFIKKYGIISYPTILFLDYDGDVIENFMGYSGIDYLFENVRRIGNANKMVHSFTKDTILTAFDEKDLLRNLSIIIEKMHSSNASIMMKWFIDKGEPYKKPILMNFPTYIHPDVFTKAYKDLNGEKDQILTEKLILCHLLPQESLQNNDEIRDKSTDVAKITGLHHTKTLSYVLAYREFNLYHHLGLSNEHSKAVYAKSLLNNYAETKDRELLILAFSEVTKTTAKDDLNYYTKLEKIFIEISAKSQDYIYYDILGVLQYALGYEDKYSISIAKANELASNKGVKYSPLLKDLRVYLD